MSGMSDLNPKKEDGNTPRVQNIINNIINVKVEKDDRPQSQPRVVEGN